MALTKRQEREMEVAELKTLIRFSLEVTRMYIDNIRNVYCTSEGQHMFGEKTREARLRLNGHVYKEER